MITVVHAFPEEDEFGREMHLRYWYGTVHPNLDGPDDEEFPVVCWCGARHVHFRDDVVMVWHGRSWYSRELS